MSWSGGKDSALALYYALNNPEIEVAKLFTVINRSTGRISMHGVREELLKEQAAAIGMELEIVYVPENPSMETYNRLMIQKMQEAKGQGVKAIVFGDIFLEDIRKYREDQLQKVGMEAVFPLWGKKSGTLIQDFIDLGFKTIVVCVDECKLDENFLGKIIDNQWENLLPENVDPCGENGEFHTFVFDGPVFQRPVKFTKGQIVRKTYNINNGNEEKEYGFRFLDLLGK